MKKTKLQITLILVIVALLFVGLIACENTPPLVVLSADKSSVDPGMSITFTAAATDGDEDVVAYSWTVNGEEVTGEVGAALEYIFNTIGEFDVTVTVTDGETSAEATLTITVNSLEMSGIWLLADIDMSDGHTAGTDGYEFVINNSGYYLVYTGPTILGHLAYGPVETYNTEDNYAVIKQKNDNYSSSNNGLYGKQKYELMTNGNLVLSSCAFQSTAAAAEAEAVVIWGSTAGMTPVTSTVPEIAGMWFGTDSFDDVLYGFTATKFGWERFDTFAMGGAGTGGGNIVSVDNTADEIIVQMIRHELDAAQESKYFKFKWTPADPDTAVGESIFVTVYGPHDTQGDAETDLVPDLAVHEVVRQ